MDNFNKLISIVTSGRLSEDSLIWKMFYEISLNSPFIGYGFGSVMTTDMGFLDIFAMSGMIGPSILSFDICYCFVKKFTCV